MSHDHNHDHSHAHLKPGQKVGTIFRLSLIFTAAFVLIEFGAGLWANSLALISDAGHNLTDAMALAFSWFAITLATRSPNFNKTYGYHRAGILAASINAATLVIIAVYVFYEAIQRLFEPQAVNGEIVVIVGTLALGLNSAIGFALWKSSKDDLNVRSAFLHVVGDALASFGAILAGLATIVVGWSGFDPLISILIAVFILWSSWGIIKESTNVLLEGIPSGLNMEALQKDLLAIPSVKSIHDLHVWTIGSNFPALSCHILTSSTSLVEGRAVIHTVKELLSEHYHIEHATLELECDACDAQDEVYCTGTAKANSDELEIAHHH